MRFLSAARASGVIGLRFGLFRQEETPDLFLLADCRLIIRDLDTPQEVPRLSHPSLASLPSELMTDLREIALDLMEGQAMATTIETMDTDSLMTPREGFYELMLFEGSSIFSIDDPAHLITERMIELTMNPGELADRAPICTVIIAPAHSNHSKLALPDTVAGALQAWDKINGVTAALRLGDIHLALPDTATIARSPEEFLEA